MSERRSELGVAVVTGASRGIGRSVARLLVERGMDVVLVSREVASSEVLQELARPGVKVQVGRCDVSRQNDVESMARAVLERFGPPRVVVNNAGIVRRGKRLEETVPADWDEVVGVNLRGPFLVSRAFLPAMREAKRGRLVHVASISSTLGCPGAASYAASKWGLVGLSKSLAEELRGSGLQSIAVLPGSVDTAMLEGSGFPPTMSPDDVARLVVYAALDAPDAMNGSAVEMFG